MSPEGIQRLTTILKDRIITAIWPFLFEEVVLRQEPVGFDGQDIALAARVYWAQPDADGDQTRMCADIQVHPDTLRVSSLQVIADRILRELKDLLADQKPPAPSTATPVQAKADRMAAALPFLTGLPALTSNPEMSRAAALAELLQVRQRTDDMVDAMQYSLAASAAWQSIQPEASIRCNLDTEPDNQPARVSNPIDTDRFANLELDDDET